jgi:hypothetical protein
MGWNQSWEDMRSKLPQDDCRFVVYMWERDPKRFIPLFIIWYEPLIFVVVVVLVVAHNVAFGCGSFPPTTGRPMAVASGPKWSTAPRPTP